MGYRTGSVWDCSISVAHRHQGPIFTNGLAKPVLSFGHGWVILQHKCLECNYTSMPYGFIYLNTVEVKAMMSNYASHKQCIWFLIPMMFLSQIRYADIRGPGGVTQGGTSRMLLFSLTWFVPLLCDPRRDAPLHEHLKGTTITQLDILL